MFFAPSRRWTRAFAGVTGVAIALVAGTTSAAPGLSTSSQAQLATARELFAQAERDEDAGQWQDALDKLRQVALVKATAGVRYHIALSEEHMDLLVSALADFEGAAKQAQAEHAQDVLRLVGGALDDLRSRVPRLAIHVTPEALSKSVVVDGEELDLARMGESRPVNPGVHTVEVRVVGRPTTIVHVTLRERDATSLEIPLVDPLPPSPPPATHSIDTTLAAPPHSAWTSARIGAAVATAAAAALAGTGVASFVAAGEAHERGLQSCTAIVNPSPDACDSQKNAVRAWDWLAAGAWAGAAVSTGLAVYLWTRPAPADTSSGSTSMSWVVGVGSVAVQGSF